MATEFHLTTFAPSYPMGRTVIRRRVDAARFALREAVYDAARAAALLDRQCAVDAMRTATEADLKAGAVRIDIGERTLLLEPLKR